MRRLATEHEVLITIEEGAAGGFSAHVIHFLAHAGLLENGLRMRPMILPDRFIEHAKPYDQYEDAGLNAHHIVATAFKALGRDKPIVLPKRA